MKKKVNNETWEHYPRTGTIRDEIADNAVNRGPLTFTPTDEQVAKVTRLVNARVPEVERPGVLSMLLGGGVPESAPKVHARKPPTLGRSCGTDAGHRAHSRRGEGSCAACREAHRRARRPAL